MAFLAAVSNEASKRIDPQIEQIEKAHAKSLRGQGAKKKSLLSFFFAPWSS
jgi:hypothetical protein